MTRESDWALAACGFGQVSGSCCQEQARPGALRTYQVPCFFTSNPTNAPHSDCHLPFPPSKHCGEGTQWPYLCGIPRMTFSIPISLDLSIMVLRAGIMTSQPSRPNLFSEDHFLARKSSNLFGEREGEGRGRKGQGWGLFTSTGS